MRLAVSKATARPVKAPGGFPFDRPLLLLLLAGAALRILWVGWVHYQPVSDGRWYYETAKGIAAGIGYRRWGDPAQELTAYWPVGYPAFLAGFFKLFGPSVALAQLLNILLDVGSLALLAWVVHHESKSIFAARMAVLPLIVLPSHVAYSSLTYAEPLVLFTLLGALAAWTVSGARGCWRPAVIAGAALGIGALAKPQLALVPAALAVADVARFGLRGWRGVLLRACCAVAAMGIVLVPWTVRNHRVFGRFVLVSTNGGANLLIGNNPYATGGFIGIPEINARGFDAGPGPLGIRDSPSGEAERNAFLGGLAVRYLLEHPLEALRRLDDKLLAMYADDTHSLAIAIRGSPGEVRGRVEAAMPLANGAYFVFLGGGLLSALWLAVRHAAGRGSLWWHGLALCGLFTALHLVFFGAPRFHHPVLALLAPYLGFAAAEARDILDRRTAAAVIAGGGAT